MVQIFSDAELIQQTKDGISTAFEELVKRYHGKAMQLALGILKNKEDAEDAVQNAFIRVYKYLDKFKDNTKFSAWFYRILYNVCYTKLKSRKNYIDISAVEDRFDYRQLTLDSIYKQEEKIITKDLSEKVTELMQTLPERYQSVLILYYIEDFKVDEIARIIGISAENVKVRLYRGRELLKKSFSKHMR